MHGCFGYTCPPQQCYMVSPRSAHQETSIKRGHCTMSWYCGFAGEVKAWLNVCASVWWGWRHHYWLWTINSFQNEGVNVTSRGTGLASWQLTAAWLRATYISYFNPSDIILAVWPDLLLWSNRGWTLPAKLSQDRDCSRSSVGSCDAATPVNRCWP